MPVQSAVAHLKREVELSPYLFIWASLATLARLCYDTPLQNEFLELILFLSATGLCWCMAKMAQRHTAVHEEVRPFIYIWWSVTVLSGFITLTLSLEIVRILVR